MKRSSSSSSSSCPPAKKRGVTVATFEKWKLENDKAVNTKTWLEYDAADRFNVVKIKCGVCRRFEDKVRGCRNFSPAFIAGTENLRTSSFKDHAKSDMHQRAMLLLRKAQATSICEYSPMARCLFTMDSDTEVKIKKKFDVAYMMAKQHIPFSNMKHITELEERHGVNLGEGYKNDMSCAIFVDYIAQDLRPILSKALDRAHFFSIQMDGSTDAANLEEIIFLAVYFDPHGSEGIVHIRNKFLFMC